MPRSQLPAGAGIGVSTLTAVLLFQACALLGRAWLETVLTGRYGILPSVAKNASYLLVPPILVVLGTPVLLRYRRFLSALLSPATCRWQTVLLGAGLGVALRAVWWSGLITWASLDRHGVAEPLFWFACPPASQLAIYLVAMSVLAPVTEEIVNRGFVLHGLLHLGRLPALLASAALFAVFHRPATMVPAAAIGLALGATTLRTGVLWPAIAAHATWNGLIAVDWLCLHGVWIGTPAASPWRWAYLLSLPVLACALLCCVALIRGMAPAAAKPPARSGPI
ncbi:MAG: CPBP family glutamic-type intramembrane protease [Pseudomonadota bacterium]